MASELLKRKSLINRLKEPDVPVINFDLINSAKDYNIESIEEDILPAPKPKELFEERDRLRIESLEQSLQDTKPFLMDESVDFIERENFASGSKFEPNISIFEDIVLNFNQGSEYKNVKDVFEEYYKITKDPLAKKQIKKGITKGTKAEKLIQPVLSLLETPEEKVNRVFTEA